MDSGPCVADPEENLPIPAASAGSVSLQSEGKPGDGSGVTVGGTDLEASSGAIIPVYSKLGDGQILESYLLRRKVADDAVDDSVIRRHIARDTLLSTHAVLSSLMRASRDLAGIEDEAARSSLAELRQEWFLARGKRKAEGTCDEEFGHDLLGSGRGKDLLDTGDSRNVDLDHIDDRPDSPMGTTRRLFTCDSYLSRDFT